MGSYQFFINIYFNTTATSVPPLMFSSILLVINKRNYSKTKTED